MRNDRNGASAGIPACVRWRWAAATALMIACGSSSAAADAPSASLDDNATPVRGRLPVTLGADVHVGTWHFDQVGPAAREIGGARLSATTTVLKAVWSGLVLGGALGADLYFPADGMLKPPNPERAVSSKLAPGYEVGVVVGWLPQTERPLLTAQLAAGFVYAGHHPEWSGAGNFVSPSLTLFLLHRAGIHIGIEAKGQYATLPYGVPSNDQKVLYGASLGLAMFYD